MVAVTQRIAQRDWEITAKNGDHFAVKTGNEYTTTRDPREDGTVTVFANFWVRVPLEVFMTGVYQSGLRTSNTTRD